MGFDMVNIERFEGKIAVIEYEEKYYVSHGPGCRLKLKRGICF